MLGKIFDLNKENEKRTIFRIQKTKDDPYARINKECLQNVNLSWKAKGFLAYMLSLPDDWVFHRDELLKHSSDGRKSLLSAIRELKNTVYLKIVAEKNISGRFVRWITCVFEFPQPKTSRMPKRAFWTKTRIPFSTFWINQNVEKEHLLTNYIYKQMIKKQQHNRKRKLLIKMT